MGEVLKYCRVHETWQDGYPFLCDCFCMPACGGEPDNLVKRVRSESELERLKNEVS